MEPIGAMGGKLLVSSRSINVIYLYQLVQLMEVLMRMKKTGTTHQLLTGLMEKIIPLQ